MALSFLSPIASTFPIPVHVSSARIQHAFVNMNTDAILPTRGASGEDILNRLNKRTASSAFIDSLWQDPSNQDLVSQFLNNSFCINCARSTDEECLPIYRSYSVQDYFFLEDYVKYKAQRLITLPEGDLTTLQTEAESLASDANYTISFSNDYVTELQGNPADLAEGNRKIAELAYGNVLQNAASVEDWFNMHVITIPCIYGWTLLAQKLLNDPLTRNDTIFYRTWIQPNSDPSYADRLSAFLDANQGVWKDGIDTGTGNVKGRWSYLFRTVLRLEIALFASAFEK